MAIGTDVAIPSNSNIRKKEHEKLREVLEKIWRVKATVVQQFPGMTSEISFQKRAGLGITNILCRTLNLGLKIIIYLLIYFILSYCRQDSMTEG